MLTNDYEKLSNEGASAEQLADIFLKEYFGEAKIKRIVVEAEEINMEK